MRSTWPATARPSTARWGSKRGPIITISPTPPRYAAAQARFIEEARMLATVKYPTIPQIFAHFQDGPHTCIVMEYVEGRDLSRDLSRVDEASGRRIAGRAYDFAQVIDWGIEVCRKLEYLASRQPPIVHHDIKPANLVLDKHSSALFLVDFGTAKAQLLLAPGNGQSGGFGTPGYAAPEQYTGASEPRSDVYALAATLYHLASDDDPTQHPFSFPQLHTLAVLGTALIPALEREVQRRPYAVELRDELEKARRQGAQPTRQPLNYVPPPQLRRSLIAPDGAVLANEREIVNWCVNDWQAGGEWLLHQLPQQIETQLADPQLAHKVEAVLRTDSNRDRALDSALALIDPYGFGASGARIDVDRDQIDFGNDSGVTRRWLIVHNRGPRFAALHVDTPYWLVAAPDQLRLPPGAQVTIELASRPSWAAQSGFISEYITIADEQGRLVLEVQAQMDAAGGVVGGPLAPSQVARILVPLLFTIVLFVVFIILNFAML
ncbi:protein kinase [Candidatus Gracilibacteria bacterium]|nr:protein kinase [Candidatus Gracilibacteria bacterium]